MWKILVIFFVAIAVAIGVLVYARQAHVSEFPSADGRVVVTAPRGWNTGEIPNADATIKLRNLQTHGWAIVISEEKKDFKPGMSLAEYIELVEHKKAGKAGRTVSEPRHLTIGGNEAIQYDIHAIVQNTQIVYLKTFVSSPTRFSQIMLWTIPSHEEENRVAFKAITESFKERQQGQRQ